MTFFFVLSCYNVFGDNMKKYFWSIFFSLLIGIYLGKFMLNQYNDFNVFPVAYGYDTLFFLEQGVYSDIDSMKEGMSSFSYYIYDVRDGKYHTYVGITKNRENASKIKEYYDNKGYDIYIRENNIDSSSFVSVVSQYDLLLIDASGDAIDDICNQVLSSYEELVINENERNSSM